MNIYTFDLEQFNPETATQEIIFTGTIEKHLVCLEWVKINIDYSAQKLYSTNKSELKRFLTFLKKECIENAKSFRTYKEDLTTIKHLFSQPIEKAS